MTTPNQTTIGGFGDSTDSESGADNESTPDDPSNEPQPTPTETGIEQLREQAVIDPSEHEQQEMTHCLSFTVSSKWGHFRRVDGNAVASTYGIPPRTTIAGLISGMLGFKRNSYYDVFSRENSRIAVQPVSERRTMSVPEIVLKTDDDNITSINPRGKITLSMSAPNAERQRKNFELLVNPSYRVDVRLSTVPVYNALKEFLEAGKAYYTPRMGKSEYLADITYHGEHELEAQDPSNERVRVDSAVPVTASSTIPTSDDRYRTEKTPAYMTHTGDVGNPGRKTTAFGHVTYNPDAGQVTAKDVTPYTVDDRTVVFQ